MFYWVAHALNFISILIHYKNIGPLTYTAGGKTYVVGVVSWGIGCGDPNRAGVYGRVTKVLPWINQQVYGARLC